MKPSAGRRISSVRLVPAQSLGQLLFVDSDLADQATDHYRLHNVELTQQGSPVNDVLAVTSVEGNFVLKLYHRNRTPTAVQWEVDLRISLSAWGASGPADWWPDWSHRAPPSRREASLIETGKPAAFTAMVHRYGASQQIDWIPDLMERFGLNSPM